MAAAWYGPSDPVSIPSASPGCHHKDLQMFANPEVLGKEAFTLSWCVQEPGFL